MSKDLEFILLNNFKCKKCGYRKYDKLIYTGLKTLEDEDSIILEKYVCRNCDHPFIISNEKKSLNKLNISANELLNNSIYVDQGSEINATINNEELKID